jgi:hypothetical protein
MFGSIDIWNGDPEIKDHMYRNCLHHRSNIVTDHHTVHSYPCSVWDKGAPSNTIICLFSHGLLARNWLII